MDTQVGTVTSLTAGEWGAEWASQARGGTGACARAAVALGPCATECPAAFTASVTRTLTSQMPASPAPLGSVSCLPQSSPTLLLSLRSP